MDNSAMPTMNDHEKIEVIPSFISVLNRVTWFDDICEMGRYYYKKRMKNTHRLCAKRRKLGRKM